MKTDKTLTPEQYAVLAQHARQYRMQLCTCGAQQVRTQQYDRRPDTCLHCGGIIPEKPDPLPLQSSPHD